MAESIQTQELSDKRPAGGLRFWLSRLRSYFVWDPLIWIYTIILGAFSLIASLFDGDGNLQHGFARLWSRMILGTIGVRVKVVGLEKIDMNKAHVFVVNHLSALDVPSLYTSLPCHFRILAKKELFSYPFMGWHLRRSGQIPIEVGSVRATLRSLNMAAESMKNNLPLMVFPEGGRSQDGHLQEFMSGAFYIAIKAQADIVPMALVGTFQILPMNTWHIQPGPVELLVGDPIPTTGMNVRQVEELTQRARKAIADLFYSRANLPARHARNLEE
ncbi:MAG: 1-acyl-sn-glycerol-3-phosphate acyltransferase [Acidobacteriia bacterium]|nr:1-acyl-sn-glycerol-3-phosphate acyltransferase [Terriglobia bacterium]